MSLPTKLRTEKHTFEPDPLSPGDCSTCGMSASIGGLHLPDPPAFEDIDDGPPPICDRCPHWQHKAPCDVVVSRYPQRLCPCGGEAA